MFSNFDTLFKKITILSLFCIFKFSHSMRIETSEDILLKGVLKGDISSIKYALNLGANINSPLQDGYTALMWSLAFNKDNDIVKFLIESKADLNIQDKKFGQTALICAATLSIFYPLSNVKLLLEAGADPNIQDKEGKTALMRFVTRKDVDNNIVTELLKFGTDLDIKNNEDKTILDVENDVFENQYSVESRFQLYEDHLQERDRLIREGLEARLSSFTNIVCGYL